MAYNGIGTKRKVFISHYKGDNLEVEEFIDTFCDNEAVFTPKVLGANDNDDFIKSNNTEYVMSQIREKYLGDSTVTIVLIGNCTHSRRYVDWEIKSSLTQGENTPNGLLGIILPSKGANAYLPQRFEDNWTKNHVNCYARYYIYPTTAKQLHDYIEDAYSARIKRADTISNTQEMMKNNKKCLVHNETH